MTKTCLPRRALGLVLLGSLLISACVSGDGDSDKTPKATETAAAPVSIVPIPVGPARVLFLDARQLGAESFTPD